MKNRKRNSIVEIEKRNALYNKVMLHNSELANKNTELSQQINKYQSTILKANKRIWYKPWMYLIKPIIID